MPRVDVNRLLSDVEWALSRRLPPRELIPMLKKLIARADGDLTVLMFAKRQLAELLVEREPWRGARLAREALQIQDDERAWAVLGLAHTLLGNYRSAAAA